MKRIRVRKSLLCCNNALINLWFLFGNNKLNSDLFDEDELCCYCFYCLSAEERAVRVTRSRNFFSVASGERVKTAFIGTWSGPKSRSDGALHPLSTLHWGKHATEFQEIGFWFSKPYFKITICSYEYIKIFFNKTLKYFVLCF